MGFSHALPMFFNFTALLTAEIFLLLIWHIPDPHPARNSVEVWRRGNAPAVAPMTGARHDCQMLHTAGEDHLDKVKQEDDI